VIISEANVAGYVRSLVRSTRGGWRFTEDHPTYRKAMEAGTAWMLDPAGRADAWWEAVEALDDPYAFDQPTTAEPVKA
jgi:hypothetical protein